MFIGLGIGRMGLVVPMILKGACRVLCVALIVLEILDMIRAARDERLSFGLSAACIVGDGIIMYLGTQLLWSPPFL